MNTDTHNKLSSNTLVLHWLVGIMMITLLVTGIYMEENEVFALYPWHKSFGVAIMLLVALRIIWRYKSGWLTPAGDYTKAEKITSKIAHYLLIIGSALLPISGFIMSAMGGHGVDLFGLELVAPNPDPTNPQEVIPLNGMLAGIGHNMHGLSADIVIIALILHVTGAVKHHIVDKDGTMRRMLGKTI